MPLEIRGSLMPEDTFFHDDDNGNRLKELVSELKSRYAPRNERITDLAQAAAG